VDVHQFVPRTLFFNPYWHDRVTAPPRYTVKLCTASMKMVLGSRHCSSSKAAMARRDVPTSPLDRTFVLLPIIRSSCAVPYAACHDRPFPQRGHLACFVSRLRRTGSERNHTNKTWQLASRPPPPISRHRELASKTERKRRLNPALRAPFPIQYS
jgi:hypothetical protein